MLDDLYEINLFYYENRTSCTHRGEKKTNEQTNKHKPKTGYEV